MLEWLAYYWPTILVCLALGGIVFAIIFSMVRSRKKGKTSCGCDCGTVRCTARATRNNTSEPSAGRVRPPRRNKTLSGGNRNAASAFCKQHQISSRAAQSVRSEQ